MNFQILCLGKVNVSKIRHGLHFWQPVGNDITAILYFFKFISVGVKSNTLFRAKHFAKKIKVQGSLWIVKKKFSTHNVSEHTILLQLPHCALG